MEIAYEKKRASKIPVSNPGDTGHDPCGSNAATIVIQTWDGVIAKINPPIDPLR